MDRVSSAIFDFVAGQYRDRLLRQKKQTRRATFNVNGLLTHKLRFLEIDLHGYPLCSRNTREGAVRVNFSKKQTLLYSSSDNSSHHGVGIIMKNELLPRLQWYMCVSSCVISILTKQPCIAMALTQTI